MFSKIKLSTERKFSILIYNKLIIKYMYNMVLEKVFRNGKSCLGAEPTWHDEKCMSDNKKSDGCHRLS